VAQSFIIVAFLAIPCGADVGGKTAGLPKAARTTADILKVVESVEDYYRGAEWVESCVRDKKTFILWYNPNSGRAACHLHGYVFDAKKKQWVRHLDRVFDGTHRVSVEVGAEVTIRDVKGRVVYNGKVND
jgi:hypothetical protein